MQKSLENFQYLPENFKKLWQRWVDVPISQLFSIIFIYVNFKFCDYTELTSLKEKNVNLARAVQKEKENYTFLLQEKNAADSCFQDLQKENACLKVNYLEIG